VFDFDVRDLGEPETGAAVVGGFERLGGRELDGVRVTEIPRGPALTLAPEASIASAVESMRRRRRGAAVIVKNHRPVGVLTDRDILGVGFDCPRLPVATVMTPCSELRETDTVEAALRTMCARQQWHLPVVCSRGLFLGALDIADISLWLRDRLTLLSVDACFGDSA
jgi:CBS domain-containing protein